MKVAMSVISVHLAKLLILLLISVLIVQLELHVAPLVMES